MRVHPAVWAVVGGGAVVLAAAGGLLAGKLIYDDGDAGAPSPSTRVVAAPVTLPEATRETAEATLSYVDGKGKVLVDFTDTDVTSTVEARDAGGCKAMAADLTGRYPVDTVLDRLHALPDPVLGEWLSTYYGSAFGALDACARGGDPAAYLSDADDALDLVDKRLTQLKEAR